jgi:four helix bundle protein
MRDFRKFEVWKLGHKLTLDIYRKTKSFPPEEIYGITSQIRRAAISIGTNISEGSVKRSEKDFARFLEIALGSATEIHNLIIVSRDLEYLSENEFESFESEIIILKKQLFAFISKLGG